MEDLALAAIRRLKKMPTLPPSRPAPARRSIFDERWGPGLDDATPAIVIEPGCWRHAVAGWPHDRWVAWRKRSGEIQAAAGASPTAAEIREADRLAYVELLENEGN